MSELTGIWMEIGANNRYAETKLAFLIGLVLASFGLINSPSAHVADPVALLRGGNTVIMNLGASISLTLAFVGVLPNLTPRRRRISFRRKHRSLNVYFFLTIANFATSEDWLSATGINFDEGERKRADMLAEQIYTVAGIAARKFRLMRLSLFILIGGWVISWLPSQNWSLSWPQEWIGSLLQVHVF